MLQRTTFDNGVVALVSSALEADGYLAAFTEREGGVSTEPFNSLNLGFRTGDDQHHVGTNRSMVCGALGIDSFASGRQVHGTHMERVVRRERAAGFTEPTSAFGDTDALITSEDDVALAVLTADCFPVAMANPRGGTIAVVHAGWRGVASGIVGKAVAAFQDPADLRAAIGPGIGADHYEVGEDVAASVSAGAEGGAVVRKRDGKTLLDLGATVEHALRASGVRHIESAGLCTACEEDRFFSYRRDGVTGRQALIARRLS